MNRITVTKWIAGAAVALVLAMSAGLPARASEPHAQPFGRSIPVQSTTIQYIQLMVNLYVRAGPGMQYPVLERFLAGNTVPVTGLSMDRMWWRVPCPPHGALGDCVSRGRPVTPAFV